MRFDTLAQWLQWMEGLHPRAIDLGLERVAQVAARLALDFSARRVITVAGTNGKGSCVAALQAVLNAAGYRVGAYTSPHLIRYNERVQIDGVAVDDAKLVEAFARIDAARGDISLTYFEFGTLAALLIFLDQPLDVLLLEVGLGGRLDAVNIVDADVAIVTSIALDHQEWLGNDREQIAREKAGIFRAGRPALCGDPAPPAAIAAAATACGATMYQRGRDFHMERMENSPAGAAWQWRGAGSDAALSLPVLHVPADSVAVALQALHLLYPELDAAHYQVLAELRVPGRCQRVRYRQREWWLDVAHNPASADYLAARLREAPAAGRTLALFAVMKDKDIDAMLLPLHTLFDRWLLCDLPGNARARPAADCAQQLQHLGVSALVCCDSPAAAIEQALEQSAPGDRLVVFGTFFLVGDVLTMLQSTAVDED